MSFALIGLALELHCGNVRARKRCRECYRKLDPKVLREAASLIEILTYTSVYFHLPYNCHDELLSVLIK